MPRMPRRNRRALVTVCNTTRACVESEVRMTDFVNTVEKIQFDVRVWPAKGSGP